MTNTDGNSVTELNASDGSWVRTISGGSYGFNFSAAIAFDGTHLWILNAHGNSVTEMNASDGSWVQTLSGVSYDFDAPTAIAFDGTHRWVANAYGPSDFEAHVTELNASDGSLVQTISGDSYGFAVPFGISFDGTHLWVTNYAGDSVTQINASDGPGYGPSPIEEEPQHVSESAALRRKNGSDWPSLEVEAATFTEPLAGVGDTTRSGVTESVSERPS